MSLDQIFRDFDEDGNGYISQVEFRNAIRRLGLGLVSREIDALMLKFDTNQDGKIDYSEFMAKFKDTSFDARMQKRAQNRMASLKELMTLHMSSFNDAFRFVSEIHISRLQARRRLFRMLRRFRFESLLTYMLVCFELV